MAAPTYSPGTPGNVLSAVSLAAGKNVAALVDLSTVLGGALACQFATGTNPITVQTAFGLYRAAAATAAGSTTLASAAASGATSLVLASSSVAGSIQKGQKVAVISATSRTGEVVVVSSASGTTLTLGAGTLNAYAGGDLVFLIEQTASGGTNSPGTSWSGNSTYGAPSFYPPAAWVWILQVTNNDGSYAVTVTATLDINPAFQ